MSSGIPIQLLHEATGFDVTVELTSGDKYRGTLTMVEDSMSCWLEKVTHTKPDGSAIQSDSAYLRGSNILFVEVPEILINAKLFTTGETEKKKKFQGKLKRTFMTVKVRKQAH